MTAKDVQQANAELRRLIIEGGMEAQPARVIRAAMQDHATELRAALLPFDRSAGWLPICDAPKDGITEMLLWDEPDIFIGMRPIDFPDDAAADRMGSACWPTHFMTLPAAPEAT